jgi:two-component sensor histidine kinase
VYGRDATRRKLAETALRESEEQFRAQYENLPVPTYTWRRGARGGDASGDGAGSGADSEALTLISFNAAAVEATRGQVRGLLGTDARDLYRHQPDIPQLMHDCVVRRAVFRRDMRYKMVTTGETKDYSVTFAYVPPDLVMVHTEDVTAQRQAERELKELNATLEQRVAEQTAALRARSRELEGAQASLSQSERHYREVAEHNRRLARELEHRVGNHLAGLLALVREMSQRGVDAADFSRAIEDRLVALAHVHRLLASEGWRAVRLGVLVEFLLAALRSAAPHACEVASGGPDIIIESAQATALGMILTEWFTNSIKYGVHSAPGGRLDVHWEFENPDGIDTSQTWIRVTWIERGGPSISGPVVPSLGTELVQGFASRELRGRSELTFPPEGATHRIAFPVRASATTVSRSPSQR